MVVVTGTKRSGTSMWMQVLAQAGLSVIGEAFPSTWGASIRADNPRGFYESRLRRGVYFATNPDPETGDYLAASATQQHAVKIFIPGVVRTERAYLTRVVATLRDWRAYARSIDALTAREDAWLAENPREGLTGAQTVAKARSRRTTVPAPVEWFVENFELVRDFAVRRYPIHFVTYDQLVQDPGPTLGKVLAWIGHGDPERALQAIEPSLRRAPSRPPVASEALVSADDAALFDDFYAAIHAGSAIPQAMAPRLNQAWARLCEQHGRPDSRRVLDSVEPPDSDEPGHQLR